MTGRPRTASRTAATRASEVATGGRDDIDYARREMRRTRSTRAAAQSPHLARVAWGRWGGCCERLEAAAAVVVVVVVRRQTPSGTRRRRGPSGAVAEPTRAPRRTLLVGAALLQRGPARWRGAPGAQRFRETRERDREPASRRSRLIPGRRPPAPSPRARDGAANHPTCAWKNSKLHLPGTRVVTSPAAAAATPPPTVTVVAVAVLVLKSSFPRLPLALHAEPTGARGSRPYSARP